MCFLLLLLVLWLISSYKFRFISHINQKYKTPQKMEEKKSQNYSIPEEIHIFFSTVFVFSIVRAFTFQLSHFDVSAIAFVPIQSTKSHLIAWENRVRLFWMLLPPKKKIHILYLPWCFWVLAHNTEYRIPIEFNDCNLMMV